MRSIRRLEGATAPVPASETIEQRTREWTDVLGGLSYRGYSPRYRRGDRRTNAALAATVHAA